MKATSACCLVLLTTLAVTARAEPAAAVKLTRLDDRVRVEIGGKLFTEYIFKGASRPYCYPVLAADGTPLSRDFPMKDTPGEDRDHAHHRALMFAHGDVNKIDFWNEGTAGGNLPKGSTVHDGLIETTSGDVGVLRTRNRWIAPDGKLIATDETTIRFHGTETTRMIDYEVTIHALPDTPLVMGDSKEGAISIRVAQWMTLPHKYEGKDLPGAGHLLNAVGDRDGAAWGKRAEWCDYYAPHDGRDLRHRHLRPPDKPPASDLVARARLRPLRREPLRPVELRGGEETPARRRELHHREGRHTVAALSVLYSPGRAGGGERRPALRRLRRRKVTQMTSPTRRTFLKTAALAPAVGSLAARSWAQVSGANGDIRVAVIGLNGRGQNHLGSLRALSGVRIAAICDVDTAVLDKTADALAKYNLSPQKFTDLRKLFASKDIDAVTIATPNHWHSLAAIWACEAGKDVYCEKPVSHNIWEGRQLVAAAKKYNRVVQAGTQIRSGAGLIEAREYVRSGQLGKITASRGFCYKRRDSIGKTSGAQPVPSTIDYDLWTGPAPLVEPHRNSKRNGSVHYEWHWIWLYGNGDVGNQGIHQMDVARWFLGEPGLPRHTFSVGGRFGYVDDGETPNTQVDRPRLRDRSAHLRGPRPAQQSPMVAPRW